VGRKLLSALREASRYKDLPLRSGKNGGSAETIRKKAAGDQRPLRPTGKIECLICSTSSPG
jgi:hypothetical protein